MGKIEWICVQCSKCSTFQVDRKKKSNKFSCKVCGNKQSITKVYATSYRAKDIRGVVQEYNSRRFDPEIQNKVSEEEERSNQKSQQIRQKSDSKWNNFGDFEEEKEQERSEERDFVTNDDSLRNLKVVGRKPQKKKKKKRKRDSRETSPEGMNNDKQDSPPRKKRKVDHYGVEKKSPPKKKKVFSTEKPKSNSKWGSFV